MYRVFYYRVDDNGPSLFIENVKVFDTFDEALRCVKTFEDDDLFEIARDASWFDVSCDITGLKTVARSASMKACVNFYYSRWYNNVY